MRIVDWEKLVDVLNSIYTVLQTKPEGFRASFSLDPGSILNAYREGDVGFYAAVDLLKEWKEKK